MRPLASCSMRRISPRLRILLWLAGAALAGLVAVGVGAVAIRLDTPELLGLGVLLSITSGVAIAGAAARNEWE